MFVDPSDSRIRTSTGVRLRSGPGPRRRRRPRDLGTPGTKGEPADHLIQPLATGESRTLGVAPRRRGRHPRRDPLPAGRPTRRAWWAVSPGTCARVTPRRASIDCAEADPAAEPIPSSGPWATASSCAVPTAGSLSNPAARELFPNVEAHGYDDIVARTSDPDRADRRSAARGGPVHRPGATRPVDRGDDLSGGCRRGGSARRRDDRGAADVTKAASARPSGRPSSACCRTSTYPDHDDLRRGEDPCSPDGTETQKGHLRRHRRDPSGCSGSLRTWSPSTGSGGRWGSRHGLLQRVLPAVVRSEEQLARWFDWISAACRPWSPIRPFGRCGTCSPTRRNTAARVP